MRRPRSRSTPVRLIALRFGVFLFVCGVAALGPHQAGAYEQGTYFVLDVRTDAAKSPIADRIPVDAAAFDVSATAKSNDPEETFPEDSEFVIDYDGLGGSGETSTGTNTIGGFGPDTSPEKLPDFKTGSDADAQTYPWDNSGGGSPFGSGNTP